ncbi:hypothetical protein [Mesorhizobium sp. M7A.F.Ca.US.010.02.1.1]|uniref:hypothetical protein n=2 Tax=unclassified Mesorhizobium TaxID=325217 RepID=UPI000FD5658E|nr:hypothetical protein [Mesorhizobium sp. M7A.F.Ca.US.010.02.1.1]RUW90261.1 hypothetical protein EOA19_21360 [Mesorhizobium sp. M7A.F.Ca.US.010.02.1.1]
MLVARAQLDFIKTLVARFERQDNTMQPIIVFQSQYIAIITLLRSVGHVFEKVDCDTSDRKAWAKGKWPDWQQASIFQSFIKPKRDALLKEFRGGLELRNDAFESPAVLADPSMPGMVSMVTTMDASRLRDADGRLIMPAIREAIVFWTRCLSEAEAAFGESAL